MSDDSAANMRILKTYPEYVIGGAIVVLLGVAFLLWNADRPTGRPPSRWLSLDAARLAKKYAVSCDIAEAAGYDYKACRDKVDALSVARLQKLKAADQAHWRYIRYSKLLRPWSSVRRID